MPGRPPLVTMFAKTGRSAAATTSRSRDSIGRQVPSTRSSGKGDDPFNAVRFGDVDAALFIQTERNRIGEHRVVGEHFNLQAVGHPESSRRLLGADGKRGPRSGYLFFGSLGKKRRRDL